MSKPGVGSLESLRAQNRGRVIGVLRAAGPVSRAEIARRTGLSRSTISSLVADLQAVGLVTEVDGDRAAPSEQGGRPPVLIALDRSAGGAVGVDFGHRHLRVAVSDLGHQVLAEAVEDLDVDRDAAQGLDSAARLVEQVLDEAEMCRDRVVGVGMGMPGPIDRRTGMVGASALLPGWIGIRAGEELHRRLDLPVVVDNDANLGGLAEWMWGAGQAAGCSPTSRRPPASAPAWCSAAGRTRAPRAPPARSATPPSSAVARCAPAATAAASRWSPAGRPSWSCCARAAATG